MDRNSLLRGIPHCANVMGMDLLSYKRTRGLTLAQLADQLGYGVSTVHGWMNAREPSAASVAQIVTRTNGEVTAADLRRDLAEAAAVQARRDHSRAPALA